MRCEGEAVNRRQRLARIAVALVLAGLFVAAAYSAAAWWEHRRADEVVRLLDRGNYRRAAHQLLRRLILRPDDPVAHYDLGRAYAALGLTEAARRQFADAVRLRPEDAIYHAALAEQLGRLGEDAAMAREYGEVMRVAPGTPSAELARERLRGMPPGR